MNVAQIINDAKLGRLRKDAQEDTCSVFAAALFDVLSERNVACSMVAVAFSFHKGRPEWYHSVVEVNGVYYDSMGEFDADTVRKRLKIHPKVDFVLSFKPDFRDGVYEEEFDEMHAFYAKALRKSFDQHDRIAA